MKFLIDECLHTSLAQLCWDEGHEAHHVNHLGLSGTADRDLMPRIIGESFIFATNNARDFLRLFALEEAHAGLVIVLPNVPPAEQAALFSAVLEDLAVGGDSFNQVLEVDYEDDTIRVRRSDLSSSE